MSYMQNAPWTPSEKVDLLVNVLQSAFHDLPSLFMQIIHEHQVYPKWNDIPLPKGRSLHSSQIAFEEMSRLYRQQGRMVPQQTPLPYAPTSNIAPAVPQPRPFVEPETHYAQQRALQPRPPRSTDSPVPAVSNGELMPLIRAPAPEPAQEPRKKRGRPSKEEAEERDRALAAEGKVYQPKKRATKKFRASTGTPGSEGRPGESSLTPLQTPQSYTARVKEEASGTKQSPRDYQQQQQPSPPPPHPQPQQQQTLPDVALRTQGIRQEGTEPADTSADYSPVVAQSPSDRLLASHRDRLTSRPASPQSQLHVSREQESRGQ